MARQDLGHAHVPEGVNFTKLCQESVILAYLGKSAYTLFMLMTRDIDCEQSMPQQMSNPHTVFV